MQSGFFADVLASVSGAMGGVMASLQRAFAPVWQFALDNPLLFVVALAVLVGWVMHRRR